MEMKLTSARIIMGVLLLILLVYITIQVARWFFTGVIELTPVTLALASTFISVVPVLATIIIAMFSNHAAKSAWVYYSSLTLPVTILGLVISGVWYCVR